MGYAWISHANPLHSCYVELVGQDLKAYNSNL